MKYLFDDHPDAIIIDVSREEDRMNEMLETLWSKVEVLFLHVRRLEREREERLREQESLSGHTLEME